MKSRLFTVLLLAASALVLQLPASAQDTLSISLPDFIERGIERSGQADYLENAVHLAENRAKQAKDQRILPRINLSTQHGLIPGVDSNKENLSPNEFYLDPDLSNDWENWAIFTRAEVSAAQPIYTWGALTNAINATEAAANAAQFRFEAEKSEIEIQLFDLYYSYQLALELERILIEADEQLRQVERQLNKMQEEGDPDLDQSDVFKFNIFKAEFEVQREEVRQSLDNVRRVWAYILDPSQNNVYEPESLYLDAVPFELESFNYYRSVAMDERPELMGADAGISAASSQIEAVKSQYYPSLFLGLSGSYANTPNRPRQSNPFIINNTNYASAAVGLSFRQNLNFLTTQTKVDRARIEKKQVEDLKLALTDGIFLELNDTYRKASVAQKRVTQLEEVLSISKNWVRQEQLDYDFGFGDVKDLLDAVQKELETRVELKQNTFELNKRVAELYKAAGIPVVQLRIN
ncbi:TolC family protein [Rhodohalobacter sp. 8-1]|uniref:TolC family protein n=1 Tax=Rhodohalobacter sp. 8-1 TaxID=3131972 RepID=UPI0030EBC287